MIPAMATLSDLLIMQGSLFVAVMGLGRYAATTAKTTVQSGGDESYVCTMTGRWIKEEREDQDWTTVSDLGAHRFLPSTTAI